MKPHLRLCALLVAVTTAAASPGPATAAATIEALYNTIMLRPAGDGSVVGAGETDPLLWPRSVYFQAGESRTRLLNAVAAVANLPDADLQRCSPLQRVVVQNRLWAVFDYLDTALRKPGSLSNLDFSTEDSAYLRTTAMAIGKLALSDDELARLADPLVDAVRSGRWPGSPAKDGGPDIYLPDDLPDGAGRRWHNLIRTDGAAAARLHLSDFGGRSWFLVYAWFPGDETAAYFDAIAKYPTPWIADTKQNTFRDRTVFQLNPALPQPPAGTQFALIRKLVAIDRARHLRPTPVTLTVQLRYYWSKAAPKLEILGEHAELSFRNVQSFAEFRLNSDTVAGGMPPQLIPVSPTATGYSFFRTTGADPVDWMRAHPPSTRDHPSDRGGLILRGCQSCHQAAGVGSINSLVGLGGASTAFDSSTGLIHLLVGDPTLESSHAVAWKEHQTDWGHLEKLLADQIKGQRVTAAGK